jgi:hypothetical protein
MIEELKVKENRLRRVAARRGFRLEKSRLRDPAARGYGKYMLMNERGNPIAGVDHTYGNHSATLDDIEAYLARDAAKKGVANAD